MKITLNKFAAVFAICFVAIPTSALSYTVGESFGDGWVFLFDEKVEIYGNNWTGKEVKKQGGMASVAIKGEGKTIEFSGVVNINCVNNSKYEWRSAKIWEENASPSQVKAAVPRKVIANARKVFCK